MRKNSLCVCRPVEPFSPVVNLGAGTATMHSFSQTLFLALGTVLALVELALKWVDITEKINMYRCCTLNGAKSSWGEGNGNPLQCSCLENPRDRGAWWAAVHGVAQSRTPLM